MVATRADLVARACDRTASTDLGPDGWQDGLDRLLAAVVTDLGNDSRAVASIEELFVRRLVTRLRVEQWYGAHGDEANAPIDDLVVIVGLPRTATTALHFLLALDPQFRYLRQWELRDPVPPPELATEGEDPRRRAAAPTANVQHLTALDGAAEDGNIHALQFHHGEISLPLPTYTAWWIDADHSTVFPYHERFLRMLHAHRPPRRWLVKFPNYLFELRALVAHYPNARFLMTHRDPVAVVPSTCSVVLDARRRRVPSWSPDASFGREVLAYLVAGIDRAMRDRAALGDDRFLDVGLHELEHDAVATAERIYDFLSLELTETVRAAMARWADANRRGARGAHRYGAQEYGLTDAQVRDAFGGYVDAFGRLFVAAR